MSGSENKDEDMARYYKSADELRERFHCCLIIIHHSGYDATHARGHSSLRAAADAEIQVAKDDQTGLITAKVIKMKDGADGDQFLSRLRVIDLGQDEDGEEMTSCVIESADTEPAPPKKGKKLAADADQALDMLREAIATGGDFGPASDHIPGNVRGVTKAIWKGYCENAGIVNKSGSHREEMKRIIVTLKAAGKIGFWNDFVWTVT